MLKCCRTLLSCGFICWYLPSLRYLLIFLTYNILCDEMVVIYALPLCWVYCEDQIRWHMWTHLGILNFRKLWSYLWLWYLEYTGDLKKPCCDHKAEIILGEMSYGNSLIIKKKIRSEHAGGIFTNEKNILLALSFPL